MLVPPEGVQRVRGGELGCDGARVECRNDVRSLAAAGNTLGMCVGRSLLKERNALARGPQGQ